MGIEPERSAREQQRKERGADLAPPDAGSSTTLSTEGIPKSISRVLDAARIRAEYRQKKRARQLEGGGAHDGDDDGAPTLAKGKRRRRVAADSDAGKSSTIGIQPGESLKHFNRRVEDRMRPLNACFCRDRAQRKPRRLNDIATAPPELKKLPRRRASDLGAKPARTMAVGNVLSMAQWAMMETERENAIRRYREMKERKAKEAQTP
ncbi:hypothetical protein EDB86DRAFT_3244765 [Lactarius hatsudake]|nr:hypothetical protein EDB86DRAFT_3244765 [Lactarius hatsudake]